MRAATLATAAAALKRASRVASAPFTLAIMSDRRRAPHPDVIMRAAPRGTAVVFRDYDHPRRAALAGRLRAIADRCGLLFLVAGDPALAAALDADGVHLGVRALQAAAAQGRAPARRPPLLTAACHDARDVDRAGAIGADAVFLSPVFATRSHPGAETLGVQGLHALAARSRAPALGLGGVTALNAGALAGPNVIGFGAIDAFCA